MEQDPSGSAAVLAQNSNRSLPRTQNRSWMQPLTPRRGIFLGKGTLPWDFINKCLNLGIMGEKSRIAQNWPGQLVLSHSAKAQSSPKGSDVPHTGMLAPSPQHRWKASSIPSLQVRAWLSFKPPANLGAAAASRVKRSRNENAPHGAAKACTARAKSCTRTSRQRHREPRQPPQNLTLHLSHHSCQNEAVAVTASSEPR